MGMCLLCTQHMWRHTHTCIVIVDKQNKRVMWCRLQTGAWKFHPHWSVTTALQTIHWRPTIRKWLFSSPNISKTMNRWMIHFPLLLLCLVRVAYLKHANSPCKSVKCQATVCAPHTVRPEKGDRCARHRRHRCRPSLFPISDLSRRETSSWPEILTYHRWWERFRHFSLNQPASHNDNNHHHYEYGLSNPKK